MLPPWIIDKQRKNERRKNDRESWDKQPRLEREMPVPVRPASPSHEERGTVEIDFKL